MMRLVTSHQAALAQPRSYLHSILARCSRLQLQGHALHVYALLGIEYSSKLGMCGASEHQADLIV